VDGNLLAIYLRFGGSTKTRKTTKEDRGVQRLAELLHDRPSALLISMYRFRWRPAIRYSFTCYRLALSQRESFPSGTVECFFPLVKRMQNADAFEG